MLCVAVCSNRTFLFGSIDKKKKKKIQNSLFIHLPICIMVFIYLFLFHQKLISRYVTPPLWMYFHHGHVHPCFISHTHTLAHTCAEIRRRINPSGIISICLTHPVGAKLSQKCVGVDGGSAFWDDDEGNEGRCSGRTDYLHGFLYKGLDFPAPVKNLEAARRAARPRCRVAFLQILEL